VKIVEDYLEDIIGALGLLLASAGVFILFGLGWALIVLGAGLFGVAVLVSWKSSNAAAPTIDNPDES
jgi:uncharacterized membrane protein YedE/YeeE